ncbi:spermidine synthase [Galactobacter valiniphilus]|uniref:spermidine synthase n=1 Tax=Galactobacter valiniphilus TaxID=2676122 RepID=UPI0037356234
MGRKRAGREIEAQPEGDALREGTWETDTGTVRLERDPYSPSAWTVYVNGVPSSHVDLEHPERLDFEYMRWMAALISQRWPDGGRLRALHLGGGACSMARWIHAGYPDARQVVVELDARLTVLVREWFSLPSAPLLRLRPGDAGEVLPSLTEDTRDLIIRDVFAGDQTPEQLTTPAFHAEAKRVLAEDGLYLLNVGDAPDRAHLRAEASALRELFPHVAAVADPAMLKGRRRGNVVVAASCAELPLGPALTRSLLGDALPAHVWGEQELDAFLR